MKIKNLLSGRMLLGASLGLAFPFAAAATLSVQAAENKPPAALEEFQKAFAGIKDYQFQIVAHETSDDGKHVEDRVYLFRWRRPTDAQIMVLQGRDKGGAATWHGGDTVSGHHGGFLSGIHLTKSIHDRDTTSLRGDTLIADAYDNEIKHFLETPGALAESAGPAIDGQATTAIALTVADPKSNANVSKDVLYLSNSSHLPLGRDQYVGPTLVKTERFKEIKTNIGLKDDDFRG
jgi:outer membrane lipoprotein-sorting protein